MGFPYIFQKLSLVFFCQSVNEHLHLSHVKVTLIIKGNRFVASLKVYNFYSGTSHTTGITDFWPLPLEQ